jgi:hypothetical protein
LPILYQDSGEEKVPSHILFNGISKVCNGDCIRGLIYVVNNGKKARFWLDVWLGNCLFRIVYSRIFDICNEQEESVYNVLKNNDINLTFRRSFGEEEQEAWLLLISQIRDIQLNTEPDKVKWALEKSGNFTTASLYRELSYPGMENKENMQIWRARITVKINFFLWSVYTDCLPSAEQLVRRNWLGEFHCNFVAKWKQLNILSLNVFLQIILGGLIMIHFTGIWCPQI